MRQAAKHPSYLFRRPLIDLVGMVAVLVFTFAIFVSPSVGAGALRNSGVSLDCTPCRTSDTPVHARPEGILAIRPHASLVGTAGPWFTAADVRDWVTTHPAGDAAAGSVTTVVSVEFLTSAEVSVRLQGENTGVPDNTLLCLVHISGTFANTSPPPVITTVVFHEGILVFDAHSGNLLVSSVG